jgi:hypothetical protein
MNADGEPDLIGVHRRSSAFIGGCFCVVYTLDMLRAALCLLLATVPLSAQSSGDLSLQEIVTPSTVILKDGRPVTFAVHGFIEFGTLAELFPYIETQSKRWNLTATERRKLARELLHRGIESRVVSMTDERPLELLVTHTAEELRRALAGVQEPVPESYAAEFLVVQEKWKRSLNCWSASPVIAARVLSNWYPISEGIALYGARYDSVEHFWQAVKYHPDVTVAGLDALLDTIERQDWTPFLARLDGDSRLYLPNAYAVEFLRHNLAAERLHWFREQLKSHALQPGDHARQAQQRGESPMRFTAYEEKVLWGDLADLFHLLYTFSPAREAKALALDGADSPLRQALEARHFDGIYLDARRRMGFISEQFRAVMLEVWKVKYLGMARFGDVIRAIPVEIRLEHFLNDGDSPDIPLTVYIRYLNEIRDLARTHAGRP